MSRDRAFKNFKAINEILDVKKEYIKSARALVHNLRSNFILLDGGMATVDLLEMGLAIELITYSREQDAADTLSGLADRFNDMAGMCGSGSTRSKTMQESKNYSDLARKLRDIAVTLS